MSKQREALQVALEALEKYGTPRLNNEDAYSAAIKTIREALAEPSRKPLTEDQIKDCEKQSMVNGSLPFEQRILFARAIERAHGIGD